MFSRILIANRGEIACRIARTARRLGVATVAVHSEAERHALHVRTCDEAVSIGPAPARDSYLRGDVIIEAALRSGAQAIHPGYGFLSENAGFAEACASAGIVFIGPPPGALRAMGSKSAAKTLMGQAGVPLVPGYHGEDQDPALLTREAARIGYPVLIKAAAGGGGKGMRRVERAADFEALLASCRREAMASFGDQQVLIERYLERPRHIEIQVFADQAGACVYLFERDCSAQRRHQKVLEEAPAPGMTGERRRRMGEAAVAAARAVAYVGAGTVEFIVDSGKAGEFFFMEMNTRLQVEHPVTEMVTGLDLVEWQLRVACGEPLPLSQDALSMHGHAIEARLYAEDPAAGFLPATGRLHYLSFPAESDKVRIDAGVAQGDEITPYYDPMIAKLITWDSTRPMAIERMREALARVHIVGVANNVEFLSRLVASPAFAAAEVDTGYIEREGEALVASPGDVPDRAWMAAALAMLLREESGSAVVRGDDSSHAEDSPRPDPPPQAGEGRGRRGEMRSPWSAGAWRLNGRASRLFTFRSADREKTLRVNYGAEGYVFDLGGASIPARGRLLSANVLRAEWGNVAQDVTVVTVGEVSHVFLDGRCHGLRHVDLLAHAGDAVSSEGSLAAPMPGRVIAVLVKQGDAVDKGTPLLVLEAMKMEYTIRAPCKGTVKALRYGVGDQVEAGAALLELE